MRTIGLHAGSTSICGVLAELVAAATELDRQVGQSEPVAALALTGQVRGILYLDDTVSAVSPSTRGRTQGDGHPGRDTFDAEALAKPGVSPALLPNLTRSGAQLGATGAKSR